MKYGGIIGASIGLLITPVAVILSLKSAQSGDFYWAGIFYPVLTLMLLKGAGVAVLLLALAQYPLFGWYTGRCLVREQYVRVAVVLLLLGHSHDDGHAELANSAAVRCRSAA